MRLFVAVYPSAEAVEHLAAAVRRLRLGAATAAGQRVGLTSPPRWHVTLAFLGGVTEDRVPAVESAVSAGVARWRAGNGVPPRLRLAGGGGFGGRRPRVLWVGLTGDVDALGSLGRGVRRELRRQAVAFDGKPLRLHLTLARPADRVPVADLAADLAALRAYEGPAWTVDAVHLVRSHLGPEPFHERVAAALLDRQP